MQCCSGGWVGTCTRCNRISRKGSAKDQAPKLIFSWQILSRRWYVGEGDYSITPRATANSTAMATSSGLQHRIEILPSGPKYHIVSVFRSCEDFAIYDTICCWVQTFGFFTALLHTVLYISVVTRKDMTSVASIEMAVYRDEQGSYRWQRAEARTPQRYYFAVVSLSNSFKSCSEAWGVLLHRKPAGSPPHRGAQPLLDT
jgi:hypothetical protein